MMNNITLHCTDNEKNVPFAICQVLIIFNLITVSNFNSQSFKMGKHFSHFIHAVQLLLFAALKHSLALDYNN